MMSDRTFLNKMDRMNRIRQTRDLCFPPSYPSCTSCFGRMDTAISKSVLPPILSILYILFPDHHRPSTRFRYGARPWAQK